MPQAWRQRRGFLQVHQDPRAETIPERCSNTSMLGGLPPVFFPGGRLLAVVSSSPVDIGRFRFRLMRSGTFRTARLDINSGDLVRKSGAGLKRSSAHGAAKVGREPQLDRCCKLHHEK